MFSMCACNIHSSLLQSGWLTDLTIFIFIKMMFYCADVDANLFNYSLNYFDETFHTHFFYNKNKN